MSSISFLIKRNDQYLDVRVYVLGVGIEIGLCDEAERESIAEELREAANTLMRGLE